MHSKSGHAVYEYILIDEVFQACFRFPAKLSLMVMMFLCGFAICLIRYVAKKLDLPTGLLYDYKSDSYSLLGMDVGSDYLPLFVSTASFLVLANIRLGTEREGNMETLGKYSELRMKINFNYLTLIMALIIEKISAIIANILVDMVTHPIHAKGAPCKS